MQSISRRRNPERETHKIQDACMYRLIPGALFAFRSQYLKGRLRLPTKKEKKKKKKGENPLSIAIADNRQRLLSFPLFSTLSLTRLWRICVAQPPTRLEGIQRQQIDIGYREYTYSYREILHPRAYRSVESLLFSALRTR